MNLRKVLFIFSIALILFLGFNCKVYGIEAPGTEPINPETGNDIGSAMILTMPNNDLPLKIDAPGDIDFFKMYIDKHSILMVYTLGSIDTFGELLDENGSLIISDDDSGVEKNFTFQYEVNPGTYYISVRDYYEDKTGDYLLSTSIIELGEDEYGNDMESATPLELPVHAQGNFLTPGDVDYVKINMESSGFLTASTSGDTDTYGVLLDEQGNTLAEDDDSGSGKNFVFGKILESGTYYIRITDFYPEKCGFYDLDITFFQVDDDYGSDIGEAEEITLLGKSISGSIEYGGDIDFFKFSIDEACLIEAFSSGGTDTYGTIYNANGEAIAEDDDNGEGKNFSMAVQADPGTYYISVRDYYEELTGDYSFVVNLSPIQEDDYGSSFEDAIPIGEGVKMDGRIQVPGDVIYYKFEVTESSLAVIRTEWSTDTFGSLYDENRNLIAQDDDSGGGKNFVIKWDLDPGTYYIEVKDYYSNLIGSYTISFDLYLEGEVIVGPNL